MRQDPWTSDDPAGVADTVLDRLCELAARTVHAAGASVLLLTGNDADGGRRFRSYGPGPAVHDPGHLARALEVARSGAPRLLRHEDAAGPPGPGHSLRWIGVPLRASDGEIAGALSVSEPMLRAPCEDVLAVLSGIGEAAAEELRLRAEVAEAGRARRALLDSVERLDAFMDHIPAVAFMKELDGRYVYVNAEFSRRFGTPEFPDGRNARDLVRPAALEAVAASDREVVASGEGREFRLSVPLPGGAERSWQFCKFPFQTADGRVLIGGVGLDVTEADSSEQALRDRERQLSHAQAVAHLGSWEWDLATGRVSWSDEQYRLFGYQPGAVAPSLGLVTARIHPDDRAAHAAAVQAGIRGEHPLNLRFRVVHPDGRTLYLHTRGEVENDEAGRPVRFFGTSQDVTALETVAQALRGSDERYRRLVEAAGDIIYEIDVEGRFTYANPATLRVLGYATADVIGRRYTELMRPDYHPVAAEFYRRQFREELPSTYFEFPAVTRGGDEVWLGQVVQLVRSADQVAGLHAVARDISARREVDRMKGEFISVVSHELRTPLTSIRGSLGLLGSGRLGALPERGQRLVDIAIQNTDRLIRLINDILDVERLESGLIEMHRRNTSLAALLDGAVGAVSGFAESAAVALEVDAPGELGLYVDPDRIIQVLTNLLANAVKFSLRGSAVRVRVARTAAGTEIRVEDRGRGIPADKLELVFARFHQVDSSDAREKGGTGLGLAIARSIVKHHGGRMWVESRVGAGSTFAFVLPDTGAAAAEEPSPSPAETRGAPAGAGNSRVRRVLIVEDDPDLAHTIGEAIGEAAEPYFAAGAAEAVEAARTVHPDLIVLDVVLNGPGTGYDVVASLKREPALNDVPLVVYSASDLQPDQRMRLQLGETSWFTKGRTSLDELVREASRLLHARRGTLPTGPAGP